MLTESSHPGYQFDLIKFTILTLMVVLEHKILNKIILKCNYTHIIISMTNWVEEKEKSYSSRYK